MEIEKIIIKNILYVLVDQPVEQVEKLLCVLREIYPTCHIPTAQEHKNEIPSAYFHDDCKRIIGVIQEIANDSQVRDAAELDEASDDDIAYRE